MDINLSLFWVGGLYTESALIVTREDDTLAQRRRRWANNKPALGQRLLFAE